MSQLVKLRPPDRGKLTFEGFVCLYLYKLGYQPRDIAPLLVYIFIPAFFGDVIRFAWPAFNRLWARVMGPLMRDKEKQQWNGVIFYLLGAWIVLSFFPKVPPPLSSKTHGCRTLRSCRSCCYHGQIRQPLHSADYTESTDPCYGQGNPSSDL